ncbi:hypothetical protein Q3G72_030764 [Acer saccharum]|nr:hypothetical protein Q3G72_030764 [Acer saccharum]
MPAMIDLILYKVSAMLCKWQNMMWWIGHVQGEYEIYKAKMTDLEGNIIEIPNPSGHGPRYRYFDAAKKLSGVKELFKKPLELQKRRTRYDTYKRIDASYYGYRDAEDGVLENIYRFIIFSYF